MSNILNATDADFKKEVLESELPVLVDFWAPWCGPCKAMSPILDEIASKFNGKLKVAKVNVDDNQQLAAEYNVRAIPTLVFIKDGKVIETKVGGISLSSLVDFIESNL